MIAIIAGTGVLPGEACKQLLNAGKPFFVISLFPENNSQSLATITQGSIEIIAEDFYKPSSILALLKAKNTKQLLFIGKVDKMHLLKKIKLDLLAIKILGSLLYKSDKDIMEALLAELKLNNIEVIKQDDVLNTLLVPPGILTGSTSDALINDINLGLQTAQAIAYANIGQTVVVKDGMILAVEAIEGTNACIKRGLSIGGSDIIICKTARIDQNKKFDLPTLGPASLEGLQAGDVKAIAWHSHCTLIAQKELFIELAEKLTITLISCNLPN